MRYVRVLAVTGKPALGGVCPISANARTAHATSQLAILAPLSSTEEISCFGSTHLAVAQSCARTPTALPAYGSCNIPPLIFLSRIVQQVGYES